MCLEPASEAIELSSRPRPDGRLELQLDGARVASLEQGALAPFLEGSCLGLAMRRMDERLVLHASSIEISGTGLALLGEKGSGKSTLALLSARAKHRFFGDEILPLDPQSLRAFAFPKAGTLKRGAFHLFDTEKEHEDPVRGTVRYHLPATHARPDEPFALRGLVFPSFATDAEPARLVPLGAEEVTLPLVQQVFGGLERNHDSLRCVAQLTELPRYRLSFSDGEAAVGALEGLATELGT